MIAISAKEQTGIEELEETIREMFSLERLHLMMRCISRTFAIKPLYRKHGIV